MVGCFWFYVLILTSSYTANLAAFFTSTKANEGELSLEALLKSGNEFATVKNYALEQYLKVSDYKVYNRIHERMVLQNGLAENTSDALEKVRKNVNLYYLEEMPFIKWVIHKKPCEFQMCMYLLFSILKQFLLIRWCNPEFFNQFLNQIKLFNHVLHCFKVFTA